MDKAWGDAQRLLKKRSFLLALGGRLEGIHNGGQAQSGRAVERGGQSPQGRWLQLACRVGDGQGQRGCACSLALPVN